MEAAALIRTGSGRFQFPSPTPSEHHHHNLPVLSRTRSAGAAGFPSRFPTAAVHLEMRDHSSRQDKRGVPLPNTLRRAASCGSDPASLLLFNGGYASPASAIHGGGRSSSSPTKTALLDEVELELLSGGAGSGSRIGGGGRPGGGSGDQHEGMGAYYREMLKADPENPLLLTNYGKYLREVEGDLQGAEDCFGRAVLASPGDADALSLYGNLVWEAHRDEERADGYFQRAVQAAPDDCYVLGSYAHFLWDAEEEEEGAGDSSGSSAMTSSSSMAAGNGAAMVHAY